MASMEAPSIGDKVLSLEVSPNLLLQLGQVTSHFRICFHIWKKKNGDNLIPAIILRLHTSSSWP